MDPSSELQFETPAKNSELRVSSGRTFSLATLLLIITAFSLWMGLAVTLPELAVPGLILAAPAIVRGIAAIKLDHRQGHQTTLAEKLSHCYYSVLTVILICMLTFGFLWVSVMVGLALTAMVTRMFGGEGTFSDDYFSIGAAITGILATVSASFGAIWLYWRAWPRKGKIRWW